MRVGRRKSPVFCARSVSGVRPCQASFRADRGAQSRAAAAMSRQRRFVLVTGMSGAGLATTTNALEDMGYEVLDNLPLFLFDLLLREGESSDRPLAIGIDSRTRDFTAERLLTLVAELR